MRPNRVCKTCGTAYSYCPNCSADYNKPKWMNMFDCEDCKIVFDTATKFNLNKITKEEARNALSNVNLDKVFTEQIQKDLANIFYEEPIEVIPTFDEPVAELEPQEEVHIEDMAMLANDVDAILEETVEPIKKARKNKKVDIEPEF